MEVGLGDNAPCINCATVPAVLILVLMEVGLGVNPQDNGDNREHVVLILVLMEVGLGGIEEKIDDAIENES